MNLNPALDRSERIGSVVVGFGLGIYAFLGGLESPWLKGLCVGLGLAFAIGGLGGT